MTWVDPHLRCGLQPAESKRACRKDTPRQTLPSLIGGPVCTHRAARANLRAPSPLWSAWLLGFRANRGLRSYCRVNGTVRVSALAVRRPSRGRLARSVSESNPANSPSLIPHRRPPPVPPLRLAYDCLLFDGSPFLLSGEWRRTRLACRAIQVCQQSSSNQVSNTCFEYGFELIKCNLPGQGSSI